VSVAPLLMVVTKPPTKFSVGLHPKASKAQFREKADNKVVPSQYLDHEVIAGSAWVTQ